MHRRQFSQLLCGCAEGLKEVPLAVYMDAIADAYVVTEQYSYRHASS
ncbi:hypothetical protein [Microbulbifer aggregans]|nr:hypothetical protein [Microbulbifer aggregans]